MNSPKITKCITNTIKDTEIYNTFCPLTNTVCKTDCAWCIETDSGYVCAMVQNAVNFNCIEAYLRK